MSAEAKTEHTSEHQPVTDADYLRNAERHHHDFVVVWNASGMKPVRRLSPSLQSHLDARMNDPWWAENYPDAIKRIAKNPFYAQGVGRSFGPLDVSKFLYDDDFVRQILDGCHDGPGTHTTPPTDYVPQIKRASDNPLVYNPPLAPMMPFAELKAKRDAILAKQEAASR